MQVMMMADSSYAVETGNTFQKDWKLTLWLRSLYTHASLPMADLLTLWLRSLYTALMQTSQWLTYSWAAYTVHRCESPNGLLTQCSLDSPEVNPSRLSEFMMTLMLMSQSRVKGQ